MINRINRNKNIKKILVFLLILGFIGSTVNHSLFTAIAAEAKDEEVSPETEDDTPGDIPAEDIIQPECTCKLPCMDELTDAACPVCKDDPSACCGKASQTQPDENSDADTTKSDKLPGDPESAANSPADELSEQSKETPLPAETDEQLKNAWNAMTTAMTNWEAEIDLSGYNLTAEDMKRIWPDVAQDNPDLFYVLNYTYFTTPDGIVQKCQFTYNTQYNQNSVAEYNAAIDKAFAEVIGNNMTDEQKAAALHDYLVQHMVYDQNANNNLGIEKRNAYEALVNGIGVCQGYTLAYAALLNRAGIEVDYCKSRSMNHIWNYVKLDGKWYHADLTYDDATASSQTGETGHVKHTYFLFSDTAMRNASHDWEANDITCDDTKYDNSWHKTAPLRESAIYTVDGNSYYLKSETVINNPNICRGAALVRRDSGGTETVMGSFEIENLGNGWPMYQMCFSRLSLSRGVLYFNVGNTVYSFNPAEDTAPAKIYQYEDQNQRIVTGLLADQNGMTLEISNPATGKIEEKITVPFDSADETEFKTEIENGISEVPDSFKDKEHLNTPGKIEGEMKKAIQEKVSGITENNIAVYDAELLVNVNGAGWQKVTKDNFPKDGLSITLPYPSNTDKTTHDFTAAHMFTEDMNGFQAGEAEYPAVTKTEDSITFKVYGLSPIAIGWKEAGNDSTGDGGDNDNSGDNGNDGDDNNNGSDDGSNNGNDNSNGSNGSGNNSNNSGSDNNGNNNNGSGNTGNNNANNGGSNGNSSNGISNNNGNNGDNKPTTAADRAKVPATGDRSSVTQYMLLTAAAFSILLVLYFKRKNNLARDPRD